MKLVNLIPLKEIDFRNQDAFDSYHKQHKLRPDTKVTIAGKTTTAGKAAQSSEPVKGTSVFGNTSSKRKWVNFDKNHSIDTNSGVIVTKGKESDSPEPKDIKGIDYLSNTNTPSKSKRKWVNFDKNHSIDTNSGLIVLKGKESDSPNPKDIKGIDRLS
jgi:hypothetical protein